MHNKIIQCTSMVDVHTIASYAAYLFTCMYGLRWDCNAKLGHDVIPHCEHVFVTLCGILVF